LALIFVVGTVAITGALATSAASGGLDAANQLIAGRDKIERSSSEARMEMLDRGTNALQERPIAGYGDGQASIVAGLRGIHNIVTIDSYFLAVALNFGIPGLIINVLFFITILRAGYIASTRPGLNADQSGISALTAASVCILLCAITVTSSEYFIIIYALGATAATAFARPRRNR
jgi:O-antigen ligase